jgi:NAD dependent epimerase/dehydratase
MSKLSLLLTPKLANRTSYKRKGLDRTSSQKHCSSLIQKIIQIKPYKMILVTGANGFIGSHLTETLVRSGEKVRAFVRYNSGNHWGWLDHCGLDTKENLEVFAGDIRDAHAVRQAMKGCDTVLHLAALIAIPYSYRSPLSYVETNVTGTLNVLQAAHELGVRRVVHTSTSEVYGTAKFVPITESHPQVGQSPYSATKIAADQLAYSFYSSFNLPVVIARPFNTYGPRQSARAVIPTIIAQIASGQHEIELGAISPTRDFNYVKDTVDGFISIMNSDAGIGETVNFGSNFEISIGDTALLIAESMNTKIEIINDEKRLRPGKSEVERLWADNTKAKRLFGWEPKFAGREGFKRGLIETAEWFANSENLRHYKPNVYNV